MALLVGAGAALFWAASVISFFVHEVVGHGGAAHVLGYPLLAFYVSPIEGFAISQTPPVLPVAQAVIIRLAGPAVTFAAGLLALAGIGRGRTVIGRMLFLYFGLICLDGTLAYAAADLGLGSGGDFSMVASALEWPPAPIAVTAFVGAFVVAVLFSRTALEIIRGFLPLPSYRQRLLALWLCFLPGPLLQGAYLAVVHRLMRPEWAMAIALSLAMALVWAVLASIVTASFLRPPRAAAVRRGPLVEVALVCTAAL